MLWSIPRIPRIARNRDEILTSAKFSIAKGECKVLPGGGFRRKISANKACWRSGAAGKARRNPTAHLHARFFAAYRNYDAEERSVWSRLNDGLVGRFRGKEDLSFGSKVYALSPAPRSPVCTSTMERTRGVAFGFVRVRYKFRDQTLQTWVHRVIEKFFFVVLCWPLGRPVSSVLLDDQPVGRLSRNIGREKRRDTLTARRTTVYRYYINLP